MSTLKQIFREHLWVVILALLTALIVAAPQIYFRFDHRADGVYQGIELLPDSPRSALAREVLDGHPGMGNVYYKDGKAGPYLWQPLQPMVVGYLGKLFSLDINNTLLLSRLVLSFAVFILAYILVLLLAGDKLLALVFPALFFLGEPLLSFAGVSKILNGFDPVNFLQIARPVNPAMTYIPFFAFLIAFWLFYKEKKWSHGVISAVLLGFNFYNYFYSWSYLYAFGGILVLSLLLQKDWREARRIASVFVGGLLVAIPYFINVYQASLYPTFAEASARFGIVYSHAPIFVGFTALGALAVFFLGFPRSDKKNYWFVLSLLLTPILTHNQQILTGRIMQVDHYHWFFSKPVAVIVVLWVMLHFLSSRGFDFYRKSLAAMIIVISIFVGLSTQVFAYYRDWRDGGAIAIERQKYGPVMAWLSANATKESVVLANNEVSHLTVIYTPLNVFYHRVAGNSLAATKERLSEVVSTLYRLEGVGGNNSQARFFTDRAYLSSNIYGIYYREALGSYEAIPNEKITEFAMFYQKTLTIPTPEWLEKIFNKYEIEYVVWDKKTDPAWDLDRYKFLEKSAEFGEVAIYHKI